jgi:hypothetical protein
MQQQPQPKKGKILKWVKASERLPETDCHICFKISEGYTNAYVVTRGNGRRIIVAYSNNEIKNWKIGEWLEEVEAPAASPVMEEKPKSGVDLIAAERTRQIKKEGYGADHDQDHDNGELAKAAACYANPIFNQQQHHVGALLGEKAVPEFWPFEKGWWKPTPEDRVKELAKAGALIAAEIDRLTKHSPAPPIEPGEQKIDDREELIDNAILYNRLYVQKVNELASARQLILDIKRGNIYQEPADECDKWLNNNPEIK